jgi:hypothetical protein
MNFLNIQEVVFSSSVLSDAYSWLRKAGAKELEAVVLFSGTFRTEASTFEVLETIIPEQTSLNIEGGLLYAVDGDELHRINVYLHESKQLLIAQMHSHPGRAYHSSTDDAYPIVTKIGALSIVVPNFAADQISPRRWAVYRLNESVTWQRLNDAEVARLIKLTK